MAKIHEKIGSQVETLSLVPKECCIRNQKFWLAGIKNREPKQFPLYIIIYNNDYIGCRSLFSHIPCIDEDIDTSNFTYSIKEHDFPIIVFSIGVDDSSQ